MNNTLRTFFIGTSALGLAIGLSGCGGETESRSAAAPSANIQAADVTEGSPIDTPFSLKNAENVSPDDIIALLTSSEGKAPTYDGAKFDQSLGAVVFDNLRFSDFDDGEGVLIAKAEFYGIDSGKIDKIKDQSLAALDAPFATAFQRVRLYDISAVGLEDEATFTIGAVDFDTLAIREGGIGHVRDVDAGLQFLNAVSLGGLYVKDLAFSSGDEDEDANANVTAPDIRVVGFGDGKLNAVIAKDFQYGGSQSNAMLEALGDTDAGSVLSGALAGVLSIQDQQTKVGTFEWRNLNAAQALKAAMAEEDGADQAPVDFGTMLVKDYETSINGKPFSFVEETTIDKALFRGAFPTEITASIRGSRHDFTAYTGDAEDPLTGLLTERGLDKVIGSGDLQWLWHDEKKTGDFLYTAKADNLADIDLSVNLVDLDGQFSEDGLDNDAKLKSLKFTLDDDNALDAIFAIAASQTGSSVEQYRTAAPAMIRFSGIQFAEYGPAYLRYLNAIADFVADGGSLTVSAEPENAVPLSTLQSNGLEPKSLPTLINLDIVHEEK